MMCLPYIATCTVFSDTLSIDQCMAHPRRLKNHCGMLEVWHNLVGNAPDATPRVVYIVTDPPGVTNISSPLPNVNTDAPLAHIVLDVTVHSV